MIESDLIVVGAGVAGLSFAIKIAEERPDLKISVLTKAGIKDSNSSYAQGGIASVIDLLRDSFDAHIADTLKSGGGLSDPKIVEMVVRSGPERIYKLIEYGVNFSRDSNENLDLALEGGHSSPRVVHSFDNTGTAVVDILISTAKKFPNVTFYENQFCMELLKTKSGKIGGVTVLNTKEHRIEIFQSKIMVLASGGIGQIYKYTTNPSIATADAISMGLKVGAEVSNLNYIQFHPTAFVEKNKEQLFLISEAVRGFGAHIVNKKGKRFLLNADKRGELATRDIVSKAIFNELRTNWDNHVYLDCRHLDSAKFEEKFPTIFEYLISKGIDITKDLVPIAPAAHYQCGGLKVNELGQTNIEGLYAIGECAETGLHGENRLASNSLLEALVFAHEAAKFILYTVDDYNLEDVLVPESKEVNRNTDGISNNISDMVKETMSKNATIAADLESLESAKKMLKDIDRLFEIHKKGVNISENRLIAENTLLVANAIIDAMINERIVKTDCNPSHVAIRLVKQTVTYKN